MLKNIIYTVLIIVLNLYTQDTDSVYQNKADLLKKYYNLSIENPDSIEFK